MPDFTLLVLSDPADPYLPMLDAIKGQASVVIGNDETSLASGAASARALLNWTGNRTLLEKVLPMAHRLEWIHSRYAGLDSVLFPALVESHIPLTNGKGVFSQSLGEFTMLGMLFFAKDVRRLLRSQAELKWDPFTVLELRGQTVGIVGYGDIGRAAAQRAHAMGMRVLALRKQPEKSKNDPYIDKVFASTELHQMLSESDYVICAAPLTPDTKHLMSRAEFAAMKPTAVILNVGRGPVIDEQALIQALREKRIHGAALDVFETEPLKPDNPLFTMENVLISPHSADNTKTWLVDAMRFFIENFQRFVNGQPLENIVDKRAGY
jgi:phosphoglycerate dehydrogenase-like enzyme